MLNTLEVSDEEGGNDDAPTTSASNSSAPAPAQGTASGVAASSSSTAVVRPMRSKPTPPKHESAVLEPVPAGPLDTKSVAQSNEEVRQLRMTANHHLHCCANTLANPFSNALAEQTQRLCEPLREFLDLMKTTCTTPRCSVQWQIDLVKGSLRSETAGTP